MSEERDVLTIAADHNIGLAEARRIKEAIDWANAEKARRGLAPAEPAAPTHDTESDDVKES